MEQNKLHKLYEPLHAMQVQETYLHMQAFKKFCKFSVDLLLQG